MLLIFLSQAQGGTADTTTTPKAVYIGQIQFIGVKWTNHQVLRNAVKLTEGQRITGMDFKDVLNRLWDLGIFDDIKALGMLHGDTLDLLFDLKEAPRIRKIKIEGAKKVKGKVFTDTLRKLFKNKAATERNLFKMKKLIERIYHQKGYLQVQVEYEVSKPNKKGEVEVKFKVKEGEKFKVGFIDFKGNKTYSDRTLSRVIHTKPYRWWMRLTNWYVFDEDKWKEDLRRIEDFYHNHGFPDARVDSFRTYSMEKGFMGIVVFLSEGKEYKFGKFQFEGNRVFGDTLLAQRVEKVKKKFNPFDWIKYRLWYQAPHALNPDLYSAEKYSLMKQEVLGLYADSGYIYTRIDDHPERRDGRIDFRWDITENWRVKVRLVNIYGNTRTYDRVIRREFWMFPGEYFSRAKLIRSVRNLYFLNYFEGVQPDFSPVPDDSLWIDLNVRVTERPTGQISAGVSYSQLEGLFGNLSFQQPNFLGRGQSIAIVLEYGSWRKNFRLSFTEPWFGGEPTSVGASLYYLTGYYFDYWQNNVGVQFNLGRRIFGTYWGINGFYKFERIRLYDINPKYAGQPFYDYWQNKKGGLYMSTISGTVYYDSRDRVFNAMNGYRVSYELDLVGGPMGGDVSFTRHFPEVQAFKPLPFFGGDKLINAFRVRGGLLTGLTTDKDIPFFEYFLLGDVGFYGLRGYNLRSVGTHVGGSVIGGKVFAVLTYEFRIRPSENFYLLAFAEAGNAWWEPRTVNLRDLKRSAGVGFRAQIPMLGIMGIDLGYGFDDPSHRWVPHFQIGATF